jgi:uncharacterized protein YbbK (DUF523 family)/uncharacterized protein YbgA (DUF1722 family)
MATPWPRPRVVVSACLGFEAVRYDGSLIPDEFVAALRAHVDFVPICPEFALGLGSPRPPVRLVESEGEVRLVQPGTGRDLTEAMAEFAGRFATSVGDIDGFILKNRSPTCGVKDARVYAPNEGGPRRRQPGLFAAAMAKAFPDLPMEDEGRLTNRELRANFLTRVFASARLRDVRTFGELVDLHTRYKFVLLAHNPRRARELGRWLAGARSLPWHDALAEYRRMFMATLQHPPTLGRFADVAAHLYGFVADHLSAEERAHFRAALAAYRRRALPAEAILTLLRSWAVRFRVEYLSAQTLFEPYPPELESLSTSARG